MNILGVVLLIGVACLAGYMIFGLVRDIRDKVKNKNNKGGKEP